MFVSKLSGVGTAVSSVYTGTKGFIRRTFVPEKSDLTVTTETILDASLNLDRLKRKMNNLDLEREKLLEKQARELAAHDAKRERSQGEYDAYLAHLRMIGVDPDTGGFKPSVRTVNVPNKQ